MFRFLIFLCLTSLFFSGCDFLFGSKTDDTTNEIFMQGSIDPNLIPDRVGYVPLLPFWKNVSHPKDVFGGYDEMVYVIDDEGLQIFDRKGTLHRTINIDGATDVTQDRQLNIFVAGRTIKDVGGSSYNLAAVFRIISAAASDGALVIDTLIHPFCDVSRNNTSFRQGLDEEVLFTGLSARADNT